ncbi:MAG: carboxypeptidase regulatory-like domain-containing protein, partial [Nitriliruptoraceae bacterium]
MIVTVDPASAEVAPGEELELTVGLHNDTEQPVRPELHIEGIEPSSLEVGAVPDELPAGGRARIACRLRLAAGTTPGPHRLQLVVSDRNAWSPSVGVPLDVLIGAPPQVSVQVVPPSATGRRSGLVTTVVHNRSDQPLPLAVDGQAEALAFGFAAEDIIVGPGDDLEIPTSVLPLNRSWFREQRHGGLVRVHADGPAVTAPMTFTQRPFFPPLVTKLVAALTILAVWAASVVVIVDRVGDPPPTPSKLLTMSPATADAFDRAEPGEDVPEPLPASQVGADPSVRGTVAGPTDPAGTTIVVEQVALGDEGTTEAAGVKLAALTPVQQQLGTVLERIETRTDDQGAFRIDDGLQLPGFYRVTALRSGFEVVSQVVNLTAEAPQAELELELVPAAGGLSGTVRDADGEPVGGADILVTDGSLTYTATSATEGAVGRWSIEGVAAPSLYEVVVSARGYASASLRAPLEGGQQASGIDAVLVGGLGTIRGQVSNRGDGVGGITVTLVGEDNDVERTTTTLTDEGLEGRFDLPELPFGTYQLTFSGEGWLTQTTEVVVDQGDVEVAVSDLRSATAVIQGTVHQEVLPGGECAYPDPERPGDRDRVRLEPCGGVGVSVVGDEQTWRTTSASGTGTFQISRVPPGEYLVRFERSGYVSRFYGVVVEAGDIITLPGDAAETTPAASDDAVVQMRLTPELDRRAGRIQAVLRNANAPDEEFEPPAGTEVSVVGEPDAEVERLSQGALRITSVPAGAQTIRVEAPGFDTLETTVRVPFEGTADAGALAITPLGSLDLRVTGGQSAPVDDARVFVAPDPAVYPDPDAAPRFEAAGGVEACTRTLEIDGDESTLDGVCASTDAVGDVAFQQAFSTGAYVLAAPVNDPATDAADDEASRASTVPLDHELLVRRVDIESGGTVRLDLTLRRYAAITGVIRRPAGDGLERVDVDEGDIEFQLIDPDDGNALVDPYPEDLPVPRISIDDNSELEVGEYRIDRIPADTGDRQFVWRLVIRADGDEFILGPGSTRDPVQGLQYNEIRTITALLTPQPQAVRFVATYDAVGFDEPQPVPGAGFRITATSDFLPREDDPSAFDLEITTCPGTGCEVSEGDGEFFDYETAASPFVEERTGSGLWLRGDQEAPAGEFRLPPFLRPGEATFSIDADGFDGIDEEDLDLEAPDTEGEAVVLERTLDAQPRDVTGIITLDPGFDGAVDFLDLFDVDGDDDLDPADVFDTLEVTLDADGVASRTVGTDEQGSFSFTDVEPGRYELSITTEAGQTPAFVDDVIDRAITIEPGGTPLQLSPTETRVEQLGVVRVDAEDAATGGPLVDARVVLERRLAPSPFDPTDYETYETLETCDDTDTECPEGAALFTELPIRDASGRAYQYRWTISKDGYQTRAGQGQQADTLTLDPFRSYESTLDRFGEISGTVEGQIPGDPPEELGTIDEATVTLLDAATRLPVPGIAPLTVVEADDGRFTFANTLEIPPRDGALEQRSVCDPSDPDDCVLEDVIAVGDRYSLRFSADGYETREPDTVYTFALNSSETVPDADAVLDALPGSLTVNVFDSDGTTRLDAQVELFAKDADVETDDPLNTLLAPDGTVTFDRLEPREYRLRVTAGTIGSDDSFTAADRPIRDLDVEVSPGAPRTEDVTMPPPLGDLTGTVTLEPFEGGDDEPADGVTVRAQGTASGDPGTEVDETLDTASDGSYTFEDLPAGTYTLTFTKAGYGTETQDGVLVENGITTDVAAQTLVADTVDTTITVRSDSGGAALEDVEVTVTYAGDGTAPDGSPFTARTDDEGEVSLPLAPVRWTLTTDDATNLDIPHNDETDGVALDLAVGDGTESATITLQRYARVSGRTTLRPIVQATATPSGEVTVTAGRSDEEVRGPREDDGTFDLFVPEPSDLVLTFDAEGYQRDTRNFDEDDFDGSDEIAAGQIPLTALTRPVSVVFESSANDGSLAGLEAEDITATASFDGLTDAVRVTADEVALSDGDRRLTATFDDLAPATWTIATSGADGLADRHEDGSVDVPVDLWEGSDDREVDGVTVTLTRQVLIEGEVVARYVEDGDDQDLPGDVEVSVAGADPDLDRDTGEWSILLDRVDGGSDLTFTATGGDYLGATATVDADDWADGDVDLGELVLLADPIDVTARVVSADGGGGLNEVEVVATYTDAAYDAGVNGPITVTGTSDTVDGTDGGAPLSLPPGEWTLTTDGGELAVDDADVEQPHGDEVTGVVVDVPLGGPAPPPEITLEPLVAVTVTVTSSSQDVTALQGVRVIAVRTDDRTDPAAPPAILSEESDESGEASLLLTPGDWALTTEDADQAEDPDINQGDPHFDAVLDASGSGVVEATALSIDTDDADLTADIELNPNSVLLGTTVEQRGDTLLPVSGVEVIAERDGE